MTRFRNITFLAAGPASERSRTAIGGHRVGRADKIEAEFPPGVRMPFELRRLCDFLDRTDYPISGYMRLRPEGEGLKA